MKNFYNLNDIKDINQSIDEILDIKSNIGKSQKIFEDKIIGLIFFNPSLRTRMSTYKASNWLLLIFNPFVIVGSRLKPSGLVIDISKFIFFIALTNELGTE